MNLHDEGMLGLAGQQHAPGQASGGVLAWLVLALTFAAWAFMNTWSVNLVADGIQSMRLYPASFGSGLVLMFAASLQCTVALFGWLTPLFFARWQSALWWPVALLFCLGVSTFEAYHAVYAQAKNSVGSSMLAARRVELASLHARVTALAAQIPAVYSAKLASFETLGELSARGQDASGVAACGQLCRGFRSQFAQAKSGFAHLGLPSVQAPDPATQDNLRASFTDLQGRVASLQVAAADLAAFFKALDNASPPASVAQGVADLAAEVRALEQTLGPLSTINAQTLALRETNAAFAALWQGQLPALEARLPLVYGVLPALAVLVLTIFMRVQWAALGASPLGLASLGWAIARERTAQPLLHKLVQLRRQNLATHLQAHYSQWP